MLDIVVFLIELLLSLREETVSPSVLFNFNLCRRQLLGPVPCGTAAGEKQESGAERRARSLALALARWAASLTTGTLRSFMRAALYTSSRAASSSVHIWLT